MAQLVKCLLYLAGTPNNHVKSQTQKHIPATLVLGRQR